MTSWQHLLMSYKKDHNLDTEYASTVRDPSTEKNIKSVENMQRQAARFVKSDYRRRSSVTTMLERLNWVSLASRRPEAKLILLFRITNNLVDVTTSALTAISYTHQRQHTPLPTTIHLHRSLQTLHVSRGNTHRYPQPSTCIEAYKHSFFPSTIKTWNNCTHQLVSKQSLNSFRRHLHSTPA